MTMVTSGGRMPYKFPASAATQPSAGVDVSDFPPEMTPTLLDKRVSSLASRLANPAGVSWSSPRELYFRLHYSVSPSG